MAVSFNFMSKHFVRLQGVRGWPRTAFLHCYLFLYLISSFFVCSSCVFLLTSIATIFKAKIPASEHKNGAKVKQIKRMHECQLKQKLLPRTMVVVAAAR